MANDPLRVVIDTNILVSALVFGKEPAEVLKLSSAGRIKAVTSSVLLLELSEVLSKKFRFSDQRIQTIEAKLRKVSAVVTPSQKVTLLGSADDRVLEAAVAGKCHHIVTGDRELLELGSFDDVAIINLNQLIAIFS